MLFRIENADNAARTFAAVSRIARALGASLEWLARDDILDDERLSKRHAVVDFEGRRALVNAAQHIEIAIASVVDASDGLPIDGASEPNAAKSHETGKKPPRKKKPT